MRPNRRPADDASCRFLSLTACISSPGQSRTPTALAESDCTRNSWGFSGRSIDEPYLRAGMETATGVRGLEPSRTRSHASSSLIIRMPGQRFVPSHGRRLNVFSPDRCLRRSFSVLGRPCLRDVAEAVENGPKRVTGHIMDRSPLFRDMDNESHASTPFPCSTLSA